ncbi:MAG TPA: hypothetical protein VK598_08675 [Nitrospiraceae bacterium]|nr:hypothetical protein [Nitrospiraceae bacterium]
MGMILKPLKNKTIVIRYEDGKEHLHEVRPLIQPRLAVLSQDDAAVLLVDGGNKLTDVVFQPGGTN